MVDGPTCLRIVLVLLIEIPLRRWRQVPLPSGTLSTDNLHSPSAPIMNQAHVDWLGVVLLALAILAGLIPGRGVAMMTDGALPNAPQVILDSFCGPLHAGSMNQFTQPDKSFVNTKILHAHPPAISCSASDPPRIPNVAISSLASSSCNSPWVDGRRSGCFANMRLISRLTSTGKST